MSPTDPKDMSTPDLESLDAEWGPSHDENDENDEDAGEGTAEPSLPDVGEIDDGWETVPDPAGGPPQRRRVPPKERARRKREKQRARAEAAAKKQKEKKKGKRRDAEGRTIPPSSRDSDAPVTASAEPSERRERRASQKGAARSMKKAEKSKRLDARGIAMIAAALVVAAVALYFMMASR